MTITPILARTTSSAGSLPRYLLTRLLMMLPMVLVLVTIVFFFLRVIGNPIDAALAGRLPPEEIAQRRSAAGYDRSIFVQYGEYLWKLVHLDFGTTLTDNRQVSDILRVNGAATLELASWALLIAVGVGVPLGRLAARHRDRAPDVALRITGVLLYAAPVFFIGLLAKLLFGSVFKVLPTSGRAAPSTLLALENVSPRTHVLLIDAVLYGDGTYVWDVLRHTVLPASALGLLTAGIFLRLVRTNLLQSLRSDYVEAARARGVKERKVVGAHAFRNALVPVVTVMGLQAALLLSGAILTERTFEWQGLGFALADYLTRRDFVAVQGIVTVIALVVVLISFLIDVVTALVDPRVRF